MISAPAGSFQLKINGKDALKFDVVLNDHTWQSDDGNVRMSYSVQQNNAEDSNGVLTLEVKGALLEKGRPVKFEVDAGAANSQRWFGIYSFAGNSASAKAR